MLTTTFPRIRAPSAQRWLSSLSQTEKENVRSWLADQSLPALQHPVCDHVTASKIKALSCTLPTLDGSVPLPRHRRLDLTSGSLISPGHHLVFCNPPTPERELEADATSRLLPPPAPFTRRMWAGGKFEFKRPIRIGDNICAKPAVTRIDLKRLDSENPVVLVEQTIETRLAGASDLGPGASALDSEGCISETRSHVYVPMTNDHRVRTIEGLPEPDFSFSYTPTDTTLFRFSALTFNAHRIHLDREYAQKVEKLPERLVHGPMTALMLLETIEHNRPGHLKILSFDYRATNVLLVNRPITLHGTWSNEQQVKVWAQSDGMVGMMGEVQLRD